MPFRNVPREDLMRLSQISGDASSWREGDEGDVSFIQEGFSEDNM